MNLSTYQKKASATAIYPNKGRKGGLVYTALGLGGESGEVLNDVKKIIRDDKGRVTEEKKIRVFSEMGDVLWYLAMLASELEINLDEVAKANLKKLLDRQKRGVIHGSGGNR